MTSTTQIADNSQPQAQIESQSQVQDPERSYLLEDIFPQHPASHASSHFPDRSEASEHPEHPPDSPRLRSIHSTAGYRDGIALARESAVQSGFDEGFLLGAAVGGRVGFLLGLVQGIWDAVHGREGAGGGVVGDNGNGNAEARMRLEKLIDAVKRDLRLENVLGERYLHKDGSWSWVVDEDEVERGGIQAVAERHPLIRRYVSILADWVEVLGLRPLQDQDAEESRTV